MRALPDVGEGAVEAVASVYGLTYDVQDWFWETKERIAPGAFTDSIGEDPQSPYFWMHGWEQGPVGDGAWTDSSTELRNRGQFYIDDGLALRVWRGLKSGAIKEWSIGYIALDSHLEKEDGEEVEVVDKGQLVELSSCVMGANPGTETISVRRAGGRLAARGLARSGHGALYLPRSARRRDVDPVEDDDPGACAQAVDAAIDEALDLFAAGETEQAIALVQAADLSVDTLLDILGVADPDEDGQTSVYRAKGRRKATGSPKAPVTQRKAIAPHSTSTVESAWDGAAQEKNLNNEDGEKEYRQMYAWVDSEADADTKSAYKFPHHMVDANGTIGAANTNACSAVIAALNGGRGGTSIPDGDRQGVWNHVAKHITDDGKEAPELRSLADIEAEKERSVPSPLALSDEDMDRLFNLTASGALTRADAISAIRKGLSA
jgi:HK97 family phage prohead protease